MCQGTGTLVIVSLNVGVLLAFRTANRRQTPVFPQHQNPRLSCQCHYLTKYWEASAESHGFTRCLEDPEVRVLTVLCVHQTGCESFYRAESLMTSVSHAV